MKSFCRGVNQMNFFCEINLSKWNLDLNTLQRLHLQKDKKMISFCENINCSKLLPFIYRLKSFWRSVNPKNFLPWNKPVKMKTISHYIRKILSAERQENYFFLWKYESLEWFSLYTEWNPSVEVSIRRIFFSITSRGGGICAVFSGCIDQFKNLYKGEGFKFVFKFKSIIAEIGGHLLAEGSGLCSCSRSFSRSGGRYPPMPKSVRVTLPPLICLH